MALDGATLYFIKNDLERMVGARIDRIHQPSREEVVITLRHRSGSVKLLINVSAVSARIHFTEVTLENPKTPPMFCMLLRKHLGSGKLVSVRQLSMDRVLFLGFETINELGDLVTVTLAVEIMGRHSNLILIGENGKIIDSIKRVDPEMSSVRPVLPQMTYTEPPLQDKLNLLEHPAEEIITAVGRFPKNRELSKLLVDVIQGVSPILSREIVFFACRGEDPVRDDWDTEQKERFLFFINRIKDKLLTNKPDVTMVQDLTGTPKDFSFVEIHQYGASMLTKPYLNTSALLDDFYAKRDQIARMKQRSNDLLKLILSRTERTERKLTVQREELMRCGERETLKMFGDLLNSNLYRMKKGEGEITLENYYDENKPVVIPLDPALSPVQNAQKYYSEYRKAATAEKMLKTLIAQAEEELVYLDSVFDEVTRTEGESELLEIREELIEGGYLRHGKRKNLRQLKAKPPEKYRSSDGFMILRGRNNVQNDRLSMKEARNYDIWLHTHNIPGSHVIIVTEGKAVPDRTIEEAAVIAAYHSKAQNSVQVPVDYTEIRNVRKPNGARPGMVIFENYRTAYIKPDSSIVERLLIK